MIVGLITKTAARGLRGRIAGQRDDSHPGWDSEMVQAFILLLRVVYNLKT